MPRKRRGKTPYPAGQVFTRARKQFQVLYLREGSFKRALAAQDLILWPTIVDDDGNPVRPPMHIMESWAHEVDDGTAQIPDKLREAFNARYEAYAEAIVREALIENGITAKKLAKDAREGKLPAEKSSQYMHANNGTSFLLKEMTGRRGVTEQPRKIRNMKFLAPKKRVRELKEGVIDAEYRAVPV